jgi:hypothetical protein
MSYCQGVVVGVGNGKDQYSFSSKSRAIPKGFIAVSVNGIRKGGEEFDVVPLLKSVLKGSAKSLAIGQFKFRQLLWPIDCVSIAKVVKPKKKAAKPSDDDPFA